MLMIQRVLFLTRETGGRYVPLLEQVFTKIVYIDRDSLSDSVEARLSDKEKGCHCIQYFSSKSKCRLSY
jgi:hypothetical protein